MESRVWSMLHTKPQRLTTRLEHLFTILLERLQMIDRVVCALYDPENDQLKMIVISTRSGEPVQCYESQYHLADNMTLSQLAAERTPCVIHYDDKDSLLNVTRTDAALQQGYQSSLIVPMLQVESLVGFIFYDAKKTAVFSARMQHELQQHASLITTTISSEIATLRALFATVKTAQDYTGLRDFETGRHIDRMAYYARMIADYVAEPYQLSDEFVEQISWFAPLHDIGKIGVPDNILCHPGRLSEKERAIVELHVEKGVAILSKVLDDYELTNIQDSEMMLNIVACHHEFLDGSGYPNHLSGDQVPIEARVITVADIFDALTSRRVYKASSSVDSAITELERMAGMKKLDVNCVEALRANMAELERIV